MKIAQNAPIFAKQARDSRPRHSTKSFSTMLIPVDPRHENALSPFQPRHAKTSPFQARTETTPDKEGSLTTKSCAAKHHRPPSNSQHRPLPVLFHPGKVPDKQPKQPR